MMTLILLVVFIIGANVLVKVWKQKKWEELNANGEQGNQNAQKNEMFKYFGNKY